MIKNEVIEKKDLPIRIEHKMGEAVQMLGVKSMKCPYCKETFFRHWRDRTIDKQFKCPHCGEVCINTSDKEFKLRKFTSEDVLYVERYETEEPVKAPRKNARKSTSSTKSKTTKSK